MDRALLWSFAFLGVLAVLGLVGRIFNREQEDEDY